MREIRVDPDYIDDPLLLEYLQSVWQPLVAASRSLGNITADIDQRFAWQPFLVRDPSVNAFALPGGYVGVHLGLIAITATRDELASVLAHEMSHVSQRHIARSISGDSKRSLVGLAALVLGMLAASRSNNPDAMNAVVAGTQAATIQGQLNFSRDIEREADRVGFQVMTAAGFAPGGMAAMFEKMDTSTRLNDFGGFPYLRSHPLTVERIGEARARAGIAAPPAARQRARAHRRAGARPGPDGHARRRAAPLASARRRHAKAAPPTSCAPRTRARSRSSLLRDWARADAAFADALAIARGSPNSSARAERAVVLMQAQSLLDRGAVGAGRRGDEAPTPATARGRRCCSTRRSRSRDARGQRPTTPRSRRARPSCRPGSRCIRDDSLAWGALGQTWGRLGAAAARAARRGRVALRARRPARRGRPAARGAALRAQRRPGRLHRRLGDRFAAARHRGAAPADRRRPAAGALTSRASSHLATGLHS